MSLYKYTGEDSPFFTKGKEYDIEFNGMTYITKDDHDSHALSDEYLSTDFIEVTPTYTQAMADNGELPVVGMGCLISLEGMPFTKGVIEYINGNGFLFRYTENGLNDFYDTDDRIVFKPITPPIELIEMELYLFDVGNKKKLVGEAYLSDFAEHLMINSLRTNSNYHVSDCKNIKHLTV